MVQILNKNPKSFGEHFGEGLERFGQRKLQQLEHRNAAQRLQNLSPNLTPQAADYLATLPPKEQTAMLQAYGHGSQPQQPQKQQQLPYDQNDPRAMAQYHLDRAMRQQNGEELEPMGTGLGGQPAMRGQQFSPQQEQPDFLQAISRGSSGNSLMDKEASAMRKEEFKVALKERQKQKEESKAVYDESIKSGTAAQDMQTHLDRMEKLVKKGNLPNAAFYKLLKKAENIHAPFVIGGNPIAAAIGIGAPLIGSVLSSLQTAASGGDIEEFEKLSSDLIRGAKEIFGSRITDADLNAFLKTIPTLDQTDTGKLRVIKNMRQFNRAGKLRSDAAKKIIKENGGVMPLDMKARIEEEVGPQLNKISDQIIKGIEDSEKQSGSLAEIANEQLLQGIPLIPGSGIRSLVRS